MVERKAATSDQHARTSEPEQAPVRPIICFGEALIDFVALDEGLKLGDVGQFQRAAGGAPANVAAGLARLGTPSAFVGQVGDDAFGHHLRDLLSKTGVDVTGLRLTTAFRTGLAFVSLAADGERDFLFYRHPSADSQLSPADLDVLPTLLERAAGFHFGSVLLASEPSRSATWTAVEMAAAAGVLISFDPNLRLDLWASDEEARTTGLAALARAQVVKLSRDEAAFLTGVSQIHDQVAALWQPGLELLVVTAGADGAWYATSDGIRHVAAPAVRAVDATGAGDAFMAGLLHNLLGPQPTTALDEAVRFAVACGSLAVMRRGAIPALPRLSEVRALLI